MYQQANWACKLLSLVYTDLRINFAAPVENIYILADWDRGDAALNAPDIILRDARTLLSLARLRRRLHSKSVLSPNWDNITLQFWLSMKVDSFVFRVVNPASLMVFDTWFGPWYPTSSDFVSSVSFYWWIDGLSRSIEELHLCHPATYLQIPLSPNQARSYVVEQYSQYPSGLFIFYPLVLQIHASIKSFEV